MLHRMLFGNMPSFFNDLAFFLLRVATGVMMAVLHGFKKTPPPERFIEGVAAMGFPLPTIFAWCAALAESGGGIFLALGFLTRPSSFFIGFTMVIAAFVRHLHDPFDRKELSLLYLAIALFFFVKGGGKWSLDHLFWGKKQGR